MNDQVLNAFPYKQQTGYTYFDNAATTQKPKAVLHSIVDYYLKNNANVHRGVHALSMKASEQYESARAAVAKFINADTEEIIFTSGATESLNIVASSFCKMFNKVNSNKAGLSLIITTEMEHNSNIVPFQSHCENHPNDRIMFIEMDPITGELDIDGFIKDLETDSNTVKFITITQVSNALGIVNDVKRIIEVAHQHNIPVCVDGAQSVAHMPIDVKDMGCDFFAFSGHKMYAPMGIGVLYGKKEFLELMPPFKYGGGMVKVVNKNDVEFQDIPFKFEAGTPNVEGAIGLHSAIDYINGIGGMSKIKAYEDSLLQHALNNLPTVNGLRIIGKPTCGIVSFVIDGVSNLEVAGKLDKYRIAVRNGIHCTHPLMKKMGLGKDGTVRVSFAVYNTIEEINTMVDVLHKISNVR